ncbi:MAG: 1-deoxy-D-xylulose-5-phosphate reductoisomerase [Brevinema sp.]
MNHIIVLGATGSVGSSVLEIIRRYPERFGLLGFSAWNNIEQAIHIIREFSPRYVVLKEKQENISLIFPQIEFLYGEEGLHYLSQISEADTIVSALFGMSGLIPALNVLKQGKKLVIANKEALVSAGRHLKEAEKKYGGMIIPLDSEHLSLFDLMRGIDKQEISELIITASGGPFLYKEINKYTKKEDILKHPTWVMGAHITVGSALMLNKGLEIIEAMRLFEVPESQIRVLVHPQSLVHGAIKSKGGHWHFLASPTDMRYPALYSLFHPEYPLETPFAEYNPTEKPLEFFDPDYNKFPLLSLSRQIAQEDGLLPTVLCAISEIIIDQFLKDQILFYKIPDIIREIIDQFPNKNKPEIEEILIAEKQAKILALERIAYHGEDLR